MSLPTARTFDEAYLYMDLRPCPCGESDFERSSSVTADRPPYTATFSGDCLGCGRHRSFSFEMADVVPDLTARVRYGDGTTPSRLLDAGEWLGIADLFEANATDLAATTSPTDEDDDELHYLYSAALAATDEVILFLPADADTVPEGSFWSQAGRSIFELAPERFVRATLLAERQRRDKAVDQL